MIDWKKDIRKRLEGLNLAPAREAEIVEELSQHLEDRYRELVARQVGEQAAYRMTVAELTESLGGELSRVERRPPENITLGAKGGNLMKDLLQDLRYGLRILRRNPGFAAVAIISLALGIGANTAIFQLFDSVFLRNLPVQSPQEIAEIRIPPPPGGRTGHFSGSRPMLTYAQWEQIRGRQQAFSEVFAWGPDGFNLSPGGEAHNVRGLWVSGNFFNALGVKSILGRLFQEGDDRQACGLPGAVISNAFWKRELGGDPNAVGKTISVDGHTVGVIGVSEAGFTGLQVGTSFDVALPLCSETVIDGEGNNLERSWAWWLDVMGRLKPGWTVEQASAHLSTIAPEVFQATLPTNYTTEIAKSYLGFKLVAYPAGAGVSSLRQTYQSPLYLLMAIAGIVLLIACANLANLLLARASAREKEIAVRLAIGASRSRLVRQLLSESVMLALLGAAAGGLVGAALARVLLGFLGTEGRPVFVDLKPDWRVIGLTAGLAILTCLLFGLVPAIRASKGSPASAMRSSSRGLTADRSHFGLRRALVVCQVALSLVMLVGAFLFTGSLRRLLTADAGLRQDGILAADFDFSGLRVAKERRLEFKRELLHRVRTVPGVESAAEASVPPLVGDGWNEEVYLEGDPQHKRTLSAFDRVSEDYFKTMAIPVLAGRDFVPADNLGSPPVAVVNEVFAKQMLEGKSPVGTTIRVETGPGEPEQVYQVVGLVRGTKYQDIHEELQPIVYLPVAQDKASGQDADIIIHSAGSLSGITLALRETTGEANPGIVLNFQVLRTAVVNSLLRERLLATLSGFFGILAAALACIGLYGVMSFGVTTRTGEIGVRMALGAGSRDVMWMILKEAFLLVAIGIAIGLPAVFGAVKLVSSLLFGPNPTDPTLVTLGALSLIAVAAVAALVPARRASRTDPMNALRYE
jgi:putative ABC transport system permease protein